MYSLFSTLYITNFYSHHCHWAIKKRKVYVLMARTWLYANYTTMLAMAKTYTWCVCLNIMFNKFCRRLFLDISCKNIWEYSVDKALSLSAFLNQWQYVFCTIIQKLLRNYELIQKCIWFYLWHQLHKISTAFVQRRFSIAIIKQQNNMIVYVTSLFTVNWRELCLIMHTNV